MFPSRELTLEDVSVDSHTSARTHTHLTRHLRTLKHQMLHGIGSCRFVLAEKRERRGDEPALVFVPSFAHVHAVHTFHNNPL